MQVVVVGLEYVGSVCSACLASRGHTVVGVDTSAFKVDCIERGESPIVEHDLPRLIGESRAAGRLRGTTRIDEAMAGAEVVLVCVGTPSRRRQPEPRPRQRACASRIGDEARGDVPGGGDAQHHAAGQLPTN